MVEYEKLEPWKGKYAVILSVNSSIGFAVAEKLLNMNMYVVGVDNDENDIQSLRSREKFIFMKADLRKEDDILDLFQTVGYDYGGADMLINIMKVSRSTSFLDCDNQEWNEMMHRHIVGYALSVREMLRSLVDRKVELCQIVNIINFSDNNITKVSQSRLHQVLKRVIITVNKYLEHEMDFRMDFVRLSTISNVRESLEDIQRRRVVSPSHYADAVKFVISMPLHVQVRSIDLAAF
ncbi:uncharacterized oxidoreductase SAS2370-like [Planococcus citri]|uniref:uncharacterized oxidoreductase SAS2370-like n=1 Tax=Planococcus citri TaxID=170843 RepID=UPI0031F96EB3